jgi:alpha-glucosidase (family GH31 glycosyl hydrolase)
MIKNIISLLLALWMSSAALAQITCMPSHPKSNEKVEIIFDAGKGNKALFGYNGDVYFHAGLITNTSASDKDWKFVKGNWGKKDPSMLMEKLGGDKYKVVINPQLFFGIDSSIRVLQMAMVFRDAKGELVAKTKEETDFLVPLNNYKPKRKIIESYLYPEKTFLSYNLDDDKELFITTNHGTLSYRFFSDHIIKAMFISDMQGPSADTSISVVLKPSIVQARLVDSIGKLFWIGRDLCLVIQKQPLGVTYYYHHQPLLTEERGFFEKEHTKGVRFKLGDDEAIYGTGERAVPLNRRGYKLELYNHPDYNYGLNARNLNYTMPVLLSGKKYLLFIDNNAKAYLDIAETEDDVLEFGTIAGPLRYYLVAGDSYENIMSSYTKLVGRQPLPPRWALGNLQSRMAYRSQQEVEGVVDEMIQKDFPLDAVILDFYWFGDSIKGYLGHLDWYKKNWPHPEAMIRNFKEKGVKTILITEPYVIDTSYWFTHGDTAHLFATNQQGEAYIMKDFYFGHAALMDMFKPATKDWFWQQYDKQIKIGVAGWWGDLGEPETHPADMHHVNGMANEVHNMYANEWESMLYEKYQKYYPHTRLFHLNRSGSAGSQKYAIFPWSGDVSRSWSGLQAQLPLMLNMSMCGLGYISSDLGGFALGEKDEELYIRWIQMGVFNPVFRPHGSGIPSEPIFFSEKTQNIVRKAVKLRYSLMPYIYNAAFENTTLGKPIVKPVFYFYPGEKEWINNSYLYYFGDEILVAPVIKKGETSKKIRLPRGLWYGLMDDQRYEGEKDYQLKVSIDEIPAFVKAGAFIPRLNDFQSTDYYPDQQLMMHYYPTLDTDSSSYSFFEDDGKDAQNLAHMNYQVTVFDALTSPERIIIKVHRDRNKYRQNQQDRRIIWHIHHLDHFPKAVTLNGKRIFVYNSLQKPAIKNIDAKYNEETQELMINMPWDQDLFEIEIEK